MIDAEDFEHQWKRLIARFGARAMDDEFKKLAAIEIRDMNSFHFRETVNVWIGERPHTRPPLLADFREARIRRDQNKFKSDVRTAGGVLREANIDPANLAKTLEEEYGAGIDTPSKALEFKRLKARIKKAEDEPEPKPTLEDDDVLPF